MEVLKLHCPSCGAVLDVPDDIDTFYCSHCGTKLLVSGQDKNTLDAKVRLRVAEKKLDLEYADKEKERQYKLVKEKNTHTLTLVIFAMMIVMGIALIIILSKSRLFRFFYGF